MIADHIQRVFNIRISYNIWGLGFQLKIQHRALELGRLLLFFCLLSLGLCTLTVFIRCGL